MSLSICFLFPVGWLLRVQGLRTVLNQTRHRTQPWKSGLTLRKRTQVGVQPRQDIPLLLGLGLSLWLSPFCPFLFVVSLFLSIYPALIPFCFVFILTFLFFHQTPQTEFWGKNRISLFVLWTKWIASQVSYCWPDATFNVPLRCLNIISWIFFLCNQLSENC